MFWRIGWILVVTASAAISLWRLSPPSQDAGGFSTDNALKQLRFIASERRPVGSAFHDQVRDYLIGQFRNLGYDVQTQDTVWHGVSLSNVIARKAGQAPDRKALMLAAHYDSVPMGPGASDDGAAVAALLEVARLLASESHRNDLIFLITDAEETPNDLPGSSAFVERHPWAKNVGVVLNFEARGTSGPSIMFETSSNNADLIEVYAKRAPHPVCSSLTYDVYKRMPNDTDFTMFRDVGHMHGLNFAFIGNYQNYHTPHDDLEHLDPRSLRHSGLQALALTRALADEDLTRFASGTHDAVYWDVLSLWVIRYPKGLALPIALIVAVFAMIVVIVAWTRELVSLPRILLGGGLLVGNLVAVVGIFWLLVRITRHVYLAPHANMVIFAYVILSVLLSLGSFAIFRSIPSANFWAAGLLAWGLFSLIAASLLPGASYLTAWPLLCSTVAMVLHCIGTKDKLRVVVVLLLCVPTVVFIAPMLYLAFLGLTLSAAWLLVPIVVLAVWVLPPMWIRPNTFQN